MLPAAPNLLDHDGSVANPSLHRNVAPPRYPLYCRKGKIYFNCSYQPLVYSILGWLIPAMIDGSLLLQVIADSIPPQLLFVLAAISTRAFHGEDGRGYTPYCAWQLKYRQACNPRDDRQRTSAWHPEVQTERWYPPAPLASGGWHGLRSSPPDRWY